MGRKKSEDKVQWMGINNLDSSMLKAIKISVENTYQDLQTIQQAKESLKDIFDDIHSKCGIPQRLFNFLIKANFNGDGKETVEKNTELEEALNKLEEVNL